MVAIIEFTFPANNINYLGGESLLNKGKAYNKYLSPSIFIDSWVAFWCKFYLPAAYVHHFDLVNEILLDASVK